MSTDALDTALAKFVGAAEEIRQTASSIEQASQLRPRIPKYFIARQEHQASASELLNRLSGTEINVSTCLQGLLVRLTASFEDFIRSLIRISARKISQTKPDFADFDASVRDKNRRAAGRLLAKIFDPPKHMSVNFDYVCKELGTCSPDAASL